jgi:hypothetical protein
MIIPRLNRGTPLRRQWSDTQIDIPPLSLDNSHIPIIPFLGLYPELFENTFIRGGKLTSQRNRGHIISQDPERSLTLNGTASAVDLKISIVSQNRH